MDGTIVTRKHEFGVSKKNGKRIILQIDFPKKKIRIVERGIEKKCHCFDDCNYLRSLTDLSVTIGIKNKLLFIIADTSKEQFTICCLLRYVMEPQPFPDDTDDEIVLPRIKPLNKIIKEGYIEKKGNAAIVFWDKRFLRVKQGHFCYYKPKKEMQYALHIINLSGEVQIQRDSPSGFSITLKDRTYSFRLINDPKTPKVDSLEYELNSWIFAFEEASRVQRETVMIMSPDRASDASSLYTHRTSDVSMLSGYAPSLDTMDTNSRQSISFDDEIDSCKPPLTSQLSMPNPETKSPTSIEFPRRSNTLPHQMSHTPPPKPKRSLMTSTESSEDSIYNGADTQSSNSSSDDALSEIGSLEKMELRNRENRDPRYTVHLSAIEPTEPLTSLTSTRPHPPSFKKLEKCQSIEQIDSGNETAQSDCQSVKETPSGEIKNETIDSNGNSHLNTSATSSMCKQKPKPLPRSKSLKHTS